LFISSRNLIAQVNGQSSAKNSIEKADENLLDRIASGENYVGNIRNYYEMILETDSINYDALTNLGVIFQQMGELEKSLRYFQKAAKFHPQKPRAFHNLGILYSLMNRLDDAVINLNKAAELSSTSPNSVRQLGIIYLQNEMFREAIESFERALSRDYFDVESRLGKALTFFLVT